MSASKAFVEALFEALHLFPSQGREVALAIPVQLSQRVGELLQRETWSLEELETTIQELVPEVWIVSQITNPVLAQVYGKASSQKSDFKAKLMALLRLLQMDHLGEVVAQQFEQEVGRTLELPWRKPAIREVVSSAQPAPQLLQAGPPSAEPLPVASHRRAPRIAPTSTGVRFTTRRPDAPLASQGESSGALPEPPKEATEKERIEFYLHKRLDLSRAQIMKKMGMGALRFMDALKKYKIKGRREYLAEHPEARAQFERQRQGVSRAVGEDKRAATSFQTTSSAPSSPASAIPPAPVSSTMAPNQVKRLASIRENQQAELTLKELGEDRHKELKRLFPELPARHLLQLETGTAPFPDSSLRLGNPLPPLQRDIQGPPRRFALALTIWLNDVNMPIAAILEKFGWEQRDFQMMVPALGVWYQRVRGQTKPTRWTGTDVWDESSENTGDENRLQRESSQHSLVSHAPSSIQGIQLFPRLRDGLDVDWQRRGNKYLAHCCLVEYDIPKAAQALGMKPSLLRKRLVFCGLPQEWEFPLHVPRADVQLACAILFDIHATEDSYETIATRRTGGDREKLQEHMHTWMINDRVASDQEEPADSLETSDPSEKAESAHEQPSERFDIFPEDPTLSVRERSRYRRLVAAWICTNDDEKTAATAVQLNKDSLRKRLTEQQLVDRAAFWAPWIHKLGEETVNGIKRVYHDIQLAYETLGDAADGLFDGKDCDERLSILNAYRDAYGIPEKIVKPTLPTARPSMKSRMPDEDRVRSNAIIEGRYFYDDPDEKICSSAKIGHPIQIPEFEKQYWILNGSSYRALRERLEKTGNDCSSVLLSYAMELQYGVQAYVGRYELLANLLELNGEEGVRERAQELCVEIPNATAPPPAPAVSVSTPVSSPVPAAPASTPPSDGDGHEFAASPGGDSGMLTPDVLDDILGDAAAIADTEFPSGVRRVRRDEK